MKMKQKIKNTLSQIVLVIVTCLVIPNGFAELNCNLFTNKTVIKDDKVCISQKKLLQCRLGCIPIDTITRIEAFKCFKTLDLAAINVTTPPESIDVMLEVAIPVDCTLNINN